MLYNKANIYAKTLLTLLLIRQFICIYTIHFIVSPSHFLLLDFIFFYFWIVCTLESYTIHISRCKVQSMGKICTHSYMIQPRATRKFSFLFCYAIHFLYLKRIFSILIQNERSMSMQEKKEKKNVDICCGAYYVNLIRYSNAKKIFRSYFFASFLYAAVYTAHNTC